MSAQAALQWLAQNESASIERLMEWLRIPSISTDPNYRESMMHAAQWAARHLEASGFTCEILPTRNEKTGEPGHPVLMAETPGEPDYDGPHFLFYGHYDVQPPDPVELWKSGPFEPVIEPAIPGGPGERIVARGAVDDKGQSTMFLEAMRAWKEVSGKTAGGVRLTVMLEGEEECGSVNLASFIAQHRDRLNRCDCCYVSDTGMLSRGKPAITYGIRGLAYTEVILRGPDHDLHSGLWGGKVPNPLNELTRILGGLWDGDRRVAIPGFYDRVRPLEDTEREEWRQLGLSTEEALAKVGLGPEADLGEKGYSSLEREWARPTAELNGLFGGYTGTGAKTVIPSHATAKVSFRLVADQEPEKIRDLFFDWLMSRTPPGCRWELIDHAGGWPATIPPDNVSLQMVSRAVEKATGVRPALIKSGGSIPVAGMLKAELGMETIFMGFGLEDDRMHSPNEKFELDCFRAGARSHVLVIDELKRT
jgi:acetylornithine deacetylase/succinyl-diaminopimelate desuccinylase-like protein